MSKMSIGFDISDVKNEIENVEYDLLRMLEIGVNNGVFVEKGMPIHIDGKSIHYPKLIPEELDRYSVNYDPFNNRKIAYFLFNRYAVLRMMEGLSVTAFFISKYIKDPNNLYATCRTNQGDYISHPFTNEAVCWIDLIYIMENGKSDYTLFNNIDMQINMDRILQQKLREEAKKKK